ncbi:MAG: M15 family metallopeptidase, partial [Candidatus Riflebacteria bacterium]|nr:M15 family metallopeptidase [Candidatus Riflebacteria bacterium]
LYVTRVNGVNRALEEVSRELDDRPDLSRFVDHPAGAFNWRPVNGTTRLSTHSYGIALDVNLRSSDYWEWKPRRRGLVTYVNRIPGELVEIFERHGFIWAGKWYHYDTMHFEYRPELLPLSGCAPGSDAGKRPASTRR